MISFFTAILPALLAMYATYSGLKLINTHKDQWNFCLSKVLKLEDSAGWYTTVCLSTASSFGMAVLLLGWSLQFDDHSLNLLHNLAFNINHTITTFSVVLYHYFADKKLQESAE